MPNFSLKQFSSFISIQDPQDVAVVTDAFCVLVEVHLNFETETLACVFRVWRSEQAYLRACDSMTGFVVQVKADEGGASFFKENGVDGAQGALAEKLFEFCCKHNEVLRAGRSNLSFSDNPRK
jgi:hypothetical protein